MNIYYQNSNQRVFGTFPLTGEVAHDAIQEAVDVGYRAFDTAQMYGNEAETGAALAACGVARGELCITTKVHPDNYAEARFLPSVERSVKDLGGEPTDVLLLHWPAADGDVAPSLRLLQQAFDRGLAKNIGVSNYNIAMLRVARGVLQAPIVTNQVEFHPLLSQNRLLTGAAQLGVPLSSYCSVARGRIFKHPEFAEIGAGYGKSAAQAALRWIVQKGVAVNTMSTKPENIRANFDIMDFTLSSVDMARIEALTAVGLRIVDSSVAPWAPEWD
ncbi:MAG: aldo/keto reductase [Rhodobacteraceae bacterium]|nr:aldo/keto reductase [Paracoccaceae bacterium]